MMSSLYIGATGMKGQGEGMGVISQNLSNVNTLGYKQLSIQFSDLMSQYMTTSSANLTGSSQKGLGAVAGSVRTLFTQGGMEQGSSATDLCIKGQGFFGVTKDGKMHYTRAGNFRFDKEGSLLDPSGWHVMGRPIIDGAVSSTSQPIQIDTSASGVGHLLPKASSYVASAANLGGLANANNNANNPFFSMASAWNGQATGSPLSKDKYSYSEPVQFYDSDGILRTATMYYDLAGKNGGNTAVEYVLAMTPSEDSSALGDTKAAGLLMAGTMSFSPNGSMVNMTSFSPPESGDPSDLSAWKPASVKNGNPVFSVQPGSSDAQTVELNLGFSFGPGGSGGGLASAAEAVAKPEAIYNANSGGTASEKASQFIGTSPYARYSDKDGYAPGDLMDVEVGADGTVRAIYSNNQDLDLYQISMFRFTSQDGLYHEGNNHYSATRDSGVADEGLPGTENFGEVASYSLEQSNVDYAREFTQLIVIQRGFQMNSKVVTTSDTMLQKALELKRT